jgi:hypothetical protein
MGIGKSKNLKKQVFLDDAFNQVLDQIIHTLETERQEEVMDKFTKEKRPGIITPSFGLELPLKEIVRGDRSRPEPKPPCIWVFANPATPANSSTSLQEQWQMNFNLTGVFHTNDEEEGYRQATKLSSLARTALLQDRTLGKPELIRDVKSGEFVPAASWTRKGNVFASSAVIEVTFLTFEFGGVRL